MIIFNLVTLLSKKIILMLRLFEHLPTHFLIDFFLKYLSKRPLVLYFPSILFKKHLVFRTRCRHQAITYHHEVVILRWLLSVLVVSESHDLPRKFPLGQFKVIVALTNS